MNEKLRMTIKLLEVRLRFILIMVVTGLLVANWEGIQIRLDRWFRSPATRTAGEAVEFYCPMHPQVIRATTGNCPICGMPLSRRKIGEKETLPPGVITRLSLSPEQVRMAGVATTKVGYRQLKREIRAVGTVEMDERRVTHLSARVPGRLEQVTAGVTGEEVKAGQELFRLYSPTLINAQEEYLLSLRNGDPARQDDARERLLRWGVDKSELDDLAWSGRPSLSLVYRAPQDGTLVEKRVSSGHYVMEGEIIYAVADLTQVWVVAKVFEADLPGIFLGQEMEIRPLGRGRSLPGKVSFISPVVEADTRTVRVRAELPNPDRLLKPGMYADVLLYAPVTGLTKSPEEKARAAEGGYLCPMDPEVVSDRPGNCPKCLMALEPIPAGKIAGGAPGEEGVLSLPASAVIDTGRKQVAYVEKTGGIFDAVEITVGPEAEGFYPVLSGLRDGDSVAAAGSFLVDAETRLNPAVGAAYFGAAGAADPKAGRKEPGGSK